MTGAAAVNTVMELHDIRPPVAIPGEWLWLLITLAVLVAAGLVVLLKHSLKRRKTALEAPLKPAWEVALESMAVLEQGGLIAQGKVKEYYSELSDIVRWYIEVRFDVRAPEMTTEEFMMVMRCSDKLSLSHQKFLMDFLNASDMVKFARFIPMPDDMRQALKLARVFVQESR